MHLLFNQLASKVYGAFKAISLNNNLWFLLLNQTISNWLRHFRLAQEAVATIKMNGISFLLNRNWMHWMAVQFDVLLSV